MDETMNPLYILGWPLGYVMEWIYKLIPNYGWDIILFTLLITVIKIPLQLNQQKSMARMSAFQPMVAEIQKKYRDKPEKQQEELMKLQEQGYKPTAGCMPMLVNVLVMFGVIEVVYRPLQRIFHIGADALTAAVIVSLIMGLASSAILFGVGTAIALVVNYPDQKIQRKVISSLAPDMINVVMMVLGAGVLMGILNGPEDAGMSNAIAQFLVSVIPESLGRYFAVIIAVISAPGTYLLNNDAFYYGVLPPLAATAEAYGFTSLQIGFAALMGQAFHFLSPLVPFIYLLMDQTEITLAQYQGYIFRWCVGIFVIFMVMGLALGYLPVL